MMNLILSEKLSQYLQKKHLSALTVDQVELKRC
jgi:hypothetical protein